MIWSSVMKLGYLFVILGYPAIRLKGIWRTIADENGRE
jgi:hypothetical protein